MNLVGSISIVDLTVVSRYFGRDFIPFPFMQTREAGMSPVAFEEYERGVIDRFDNGDLRAIRNWAGTYVRSDIRVEAHVQFIPADTTSVRVVAHRMGDSGYFARQTVADVVEIFSLSPYDLGGAVAEAMETAKPGSQPAIVIPEYQPRKPVVAEDAGVSVTSREESSGAAKILRSDLVAVATVQSHWRPTRKWGVDRAKAAVVWVRPANDGDYIYSPEFSAAHPMSKAQLAQRIDRLIADDIAVLRHFVSRT
jgi:hypothetical protein